MPIIEALQKHKKNNPTSLHVPGHKNGRIFHPALAADFENILPYDLTELEGLDDLQAPTGIIMQAQQKAAQLYKAQETFFLVGGTTVGNLAMVYSLFEPGDIILIQRNSHKSIFNAVQVAGVTPVLLSPEFDRETGIPIGLALETIIEALEKYPDAKGLVITYPNYFGVSLDMKTVISEAKQHGLLVLADEAHAAHYCTSDCFPRSTLELGADVVTQSAHKMLPALTMSSFLHISDKLNQERRHRIKEALAIFQSSSPSYLLMASLDGARAYIESLDDLKIKEIIEGVTRVKAELAKIKQLKVVEWDESYLLDPLKVTIRTTTKLSGFDLQKIFYRHQLYTELADDKHVLLVFGLGHHNVSNEALEQLSQELSSYEVLEARSSKNEIICYRKSQQINVTSREMYSLPKKRISLENAVGFIAAEAIIPYPPGIPIVVPGEEIDEAIIIEVKKLKQAGARFQTEREVVDVLVIDSEDIDE
ncbi:aminotransferase class I/II-fold pyridoxal phosphate-dependent enzyme [Halalkalibacter krulwichiae]|nr:aminotransferase class V-fold PLP-dependent enzyme [Halalkalibacter krulwichiae]